MPSVLLLLFAAAIVLLLVVVVFLFQKLKERSIKIQSAEQKIEDLELAILENEEKLILERTQLNQQNVSLSSKVQNLEIQAVENSRYKQFFEASMAFLFTLDREGRFNYANKTFLHKLGYSLNELCNLHFSDLLDDLEKIKFKQFLDQPFPSLAKHFFSEWQLEDRFGEKTKIALWQFAQADELDILQNISCLGVEAQFLSGFKNHFFISESFHSLFDHDQNLTLGFRLSDRDTNNTQYQLLFASKSVAKLAELNPYEIEGLTLDMISESLAQGVQQALETPAAPVFWTSSKNPDLVFLLNVLMHEDKLLVQGIDVSQLSSEKKLADEQRKFFAKILENTPAELVVFNGDERYKYVNSAAVKDPVMRQWLIGKTDSDYLKERSKNFHKAMVRKSRFDQMRLSKKDVHFEEFEWTRNNTLKHYLRNLTECRCTESADFFLMTGLDTTELYKRIESQAFLIDKFYFKYRWSSFLSSLSEYSTDPKSASENKLSKEVGAEFYADFFEPDYSFQSFPSNLFLLKESLEARSYQWESLHFQFSLAEEDKNIYLLPSVLIWETLAKLSVLKVEGPITVGVFSKLASTEKASLLFVVDLQSIIAHPHALEYLQVIEAIWKSEGFQASNSDGCLSLSCPLNMLDQLVNDPKQKPVQILKNRTILVGPLVDTWITKVSDLLQNYGAQVILAQHHLALRKYLDQGPIDCIVWKESKSASQQILAESLSGADVPVVWFFNHPENGSGKKPLPKWRYSPVPASMDAVVELVWQQAADQSDYTTTTGISSGEVKAKPALVLNFDQLLEITEGDKRFMSSLMDTYFKTLEDCQHVFREELSQGNVEGLRFLLHKIRATTKTFEIKALEKTIVDGIERISTGKALTMAELEERSATMNQICSEVIAQIREYATRENVPIKS